VTARIQGTGISFRQPLEAGNNQPVAIPPSVQPMQNPLAQPTIPFHVAPALQEIGVQEAVR
jgi:hypothetical protein